MESAQRHPGKRRRGTERTRPGSLRYRWRARPCRGSRTSSSLYGFDERTPRQPPMREIKIANQREGNCTFEETQRARMGDRAEAVSCRRGPTASDRTSACGVHRRIVSALDKKYPRSNNKPPTRRERHCRQTGTGASELRQTDEPYRKRSGVTRRFQRQASRSEIHIVMPRLIDGSD